ncbi:hypothetical protein SLEP1_g21852 [Rubroshorea leprosula]|uniref:Uncharacterized protein n=1 Tax=Rubroshorea leprosula TaxID=152421 RepID=A0AAV5JGM7_9ROSI|nr:hypothetical protein SLEP1_g21852 [Rubroshorea leprosula]
MLSNNFSTSSLFRYLSLHLCCAYKVVTSLHANIEDEFESLFLETQVGKILDMEEQLVEEQSLDPLFSDKLEASIGSRFVSRVFLLYSFSKRASSMDVAWNFLTVKETEIQFLRAMLEKAEEKMLLVQARINQLKKGTAEVLGSTDVVEKLRGSISSYQT